MAKHMSKCLHWSGTAMPATSCVQLPFGGAILLIGSKIAPPNIWGTNLKLHTWISSSPKISSTPLHNSGLQHHVRKPPLLNPSLFYEICRGGSAPPFFRRLSKNNLFSEICQFFVRIVCENFVRIDFSQPELCRGMLLCVYIFTWICIDTYFSILTINSVEFADSFAAHNILAMSNVNAPHNSMVVGYVG